MARALIAVVLALSVVFAAGAVWAGDVSGKVKVIQMGDRILVLEDGTQLIWPATYVISKDIKEGSQVKATYEPGADGKFVLKKLEIVK
jgi:hypothetical protein